MQVHRLITPKADVIKTMINRYIDSEAETRYYLEDIQDHGLFHLISDNNGSKPNIV